MQANQLDFRAFHFYQILPVENSVLFYASKLKKQRTTIKKSFSLHVHNESKSSDFTVKAGINDKLTQNCLDLLNIIELR